MNKDNLRKVKWVVDIEYHYGNKKLTKEQGNIYTGTVFLIDDDYKETLIEEIGKDNFNKIKPVEIYEYGYFHQWIVENYGNSYEGFSTYVYALIETEKGNVCKLSYDGFTFID